MAVVVQKYGGSSLGTAEKIKSVAKTVVEKRKQGFDLVVVVSAMGDTTDNLLSLAKSVSNNPDKRELDALLSTGEMISSALLAMAIKDLGQDAISYTAYQIGIKTSGQYGKSLIDNIDSKKIQESLENGKVVIVTGFQGINEIGDITTLGRGGSDTSAVALSVVLNGSCEIFTDVDGIYSVDPRVYKRAKKINIIDYEEILELSSLGAQVMHSRSIELGEKYKVPIYLGLSNSNIKGTIIREVKEMHLEEKPITGIATSDSDVAVTLMNIDNKVVTLPKLFKGIADRKINIDMISQTTPIDNKVNISFTIPTDDLDESLEIIGEFIERENIIIDEDLTKFSVVGIGMKTTSGVAATIFNIFAENDIEIKMITTSEIRITYGIKTGDKLKAVELIGSHFNL